LAVSEKRHRAPATARRVPFLFVNAARSVILQPYALAHVFAHLALGHGNVVDRRTEWARTNPREAAANDFAEEFVAPARAVSRW
jgi:Zn-dependent peptidase ImmA (M78 family)